MSITEKRFLIFAILIVTDFKSAFTANTPADLPGSKITFQTFLTNIGGHYDTSSGRFTCQHPGIYLFSLNLLKNEDAPATACLIYLNNFLKAGTNTNPQETGGFTGGSNTILLHLLSGDVVHLGNCKSAGTMANDFFTSFTGILLLAD